MALTVLVVGAGVGGLCLAQGLRGAGIAVRVVERDRSMAAGGAYRLRIDEQGLAALARCLPPDLLELFQATCNPAQAPRVAILDHQLETLLSWGNEAAPGGTAPGGTAPANPARTNPARTNPARTNPARTSAVTNRQTLREILLAGLDDTVEYGREVVRVEDKGDSVCAYLVDGGIEAGDLLVAADGIDSVVRGQLMPDAPMVDIGLCGVYGQASLDIDLLQILPETLFGGSAPILGPDGLTLVVGAWQPRISPQRAAAELAPYARLSHVGDCVQWALVGPAEAFRPAGDPPWSAPPQRLHAIAHRLTSNWHPALHEMIGHSSVETTSVFRIRAALPVPPWPSTRITLLGDAVHATTAVGGSGANTALRDAALLTEQLAEVAAGRATLPEAIAGYEEPMREYGFAAAVRSLRSAEQIFRVYIPELT